MNHDEPVESNEVLTKDQPQKADEPIYNLDADPGSFTIPCDIGQLHINNALADLGASIILMPYTMYEKLGLGEPKATRMNLELADRSIQYPRGIVENVLIEVDKFVLPIDFVILDMPKDSRVPIILGRPFLEISRAMIDMFTKKITLKVGDDEVIFDMDQSIKRSLTEDDECYEVDDLDDKINAEAQELLANDMTDSFLLKGLEKSIEQSDIESYECEAADDSDSIRHIEVVNTQYPVEKKTAKPNKVDREQLYSASANEIDEKKPELKFLPQHLEYAYLHGDKYFPIIISSKLSKREKMLLLQVLEKRKGAIAWKMSDIKGIVQDIVKNEIVKLLDSGLIYPISDSSWVSPIHVVPKKGGMAVVLNDNNELLLLAQLQDGEIFPNSDRTRRSRKDNIELSLWDFCLPTNVVWIMQRTDYFSKMHDGNFPRHGGRLYGSMHGRLLGIRARIEVDRAKIDVIAKLPYPTNVKGMRSFLGQAGFYRRFVKYFSMISKPMTQLLIKEAKFDFSDDCKKAFNILKEKLTTTPIIISPDWNVPFELMCNASDFAVGAVLGQRIDEKFKPIYYASKTLNNAQEHYTTTKKNFLQLFSLLINFARTISYQKPLSILIIQL
ncbi:DNA-directed DNA polymerase [Tanacetum coccineum]